MYSNFSTMMKALFLFSLTILFLTSCSKDDAKPKASSELTGTWQAIDTYNHNEPDRDRATKYILNLIQTQSGVITGDGETSYTKKEVSQTQEDEWRGPFPFTFKSITYDHPVLRFTLKYESGEEDEVFDGLVSNDRNKIEGNIKYISVQGEGNKVVFERK